jgi:hypothetical protein
VLYKQSVRQQLSQLIYPHSLIHFNKVNLLLLLLEIFLAQMSVESTAWRLLLHAKRERSLRSFAMPAANTPNRSEYCWLLRHVVLGSKIRRFKMKDGLHAAASLWLTVLLLLVGAHVVFSGGLYYSIRAPLLLSYSMIVFLCFSSACCASGDDDDVTPVATFWWFA